jgi:hypothetical protein
MLVNFHLHLYANAPSLQLTFAGTISFNGQQLRLWQITNVDQALMDIEFEQLIERLSELPRMFCELDGSFVWRGELAVPTGNGSEGSSPDLPTSLINISDQPMHWQIDGMIYDTAGRVCRLELKGTAAQPHLLAISRCCHAKQALVVQCLQLGPQSGPAKFVLMEELLEAWEK